MQPKVVVGLPVYNGENALRRCIESVLSQTYVDFTLIISDNASTDSTSCICDEYEKHDKRIIYVRQKKHLGPKENFHFVLNYHESDYFAWIAHDDFWENSFLEKNISVLNSNDNVVGSIGQTKYIDNYIHKFDYNENDNIIQHFYKKTRRHFLSLKYYNIDKSNYEERVKICLRSRKYSLLFYSLFRTNTLKKVIHHQLQGYDNILILRILNYGNIHVFDDVLIYRSMGGLSTRNNSIDLLIRKDIKLYKIIFPRIPFLIWCKNNLGIKIIFQNIPYFISISSTGPWGFLLSLIKYFEFRKNKKDYYFVKDLA